MRPFFDAFVKVFIVCQSYQRNNAIVQVVRERKTPFERANQIPIMLEKRKCKDYYTRYVKRKVSSDDIPYNQKKKKKERPRSF